MFSNDAIDIIISNTIFADGSAALILNSSSGEAGSSTLTIQKFSSLIIPEWRDTLRFRTERGHLKNVLGKYVPEQAAEATQKIVDALAEQVDLPDSGIQHWIVHAGGEKILQEIETRLELKENDLDASRTVLKNYGNMSSPTVLFVLAEQISSRSPSAGEWGLMTSFGAGFSAYGVLIQWA
jgi:predicted naringenin-chalcone synthase